MKRYSTAIIVLVAILGLLYYLFDESTVNLKRRKSAYDNTQSQVEVMKNQRDASSNQIIALNRGVNDSVGFLDAWREYYNANREYESIISASAEKSGCSVINRKWGTRSLNVGKLNYEAEEFTGTVVGDYRDIVKFIGEIESRLQTSSVFGLEFKQGVNDVACSIIIHFPALSGAIGGLK